MYKSMHSIYKTEICEYNYKTGKQKRRNNQLRKVIEKLKFLIRDIKVIQDFPG